MVHRSKQPTIRNRRQNKFNFSDQMNYTSCIKMRIEPRDRIYVKGYEYLCFPKSMSKNISNKYFLIQLKNL